jgi:hypothetical protein
MSADHDRLEPNRDQLEIFIEGIFRHCGSDGVVSLRAFYEDGSRKSFRISDIPLKGGLRFLMEAAEDDARRAAQYPKPVNFCPPLVTFPLNGRAREQDILEAPAISIELDQNPSAALETLERLPGIGPATFVVRSGGTWINPTTGEIEDKLHAHWRLKKPARGGDIAKLKQARRLATELVGGDHSHIPPSHPIRWPGSWHRKAKPRLCEIVDNDHIDFELDLDAALAALEAAAPKTKSHSKGNGAASTFDERGPLDWDNAFGNIITGEFYHPTLTPLAASLAACGVPEAANKRVLRALLVNTQTTDPERLARRDTELGKLDDTVRSGHEKFAEKEEPPKGTLTLRYGWEAARPQPMGTVIRGLLHGGSLTLFYGPPKSGKSFLLTSAFIAIAAGDKERMGHTIVRPGPVLYIACEGFAGYWKRMQAEAKVRHWEEGTFPKNFVLATGRPHLIKLSDKTHAAAPHPDDVLAAIESVKVRFNQAPVGVAVDTVFRSIGAGNVNASDHMNAYLAALADVTDQGIAAAVVHHETKAGGTPAGSITLTAGADTIVNTQNIEGLNGKEHSWQIEDAKDDAATEARKFVLEVIQVDDDPDGQPASSCVVRAVSGEVVKTKKMTDDQVAFREHLATLMAEHGHPMVPVTGMPTVTGMTRESMRRGLIDRGWFHEGQITDKRTLTNDGYKAEYNALKAMKTRKLFAFDRAHVWMLAGSVPVSTLHSPHSPA